MGKKFFRWETDTHHVPNTHTDILSVIFANRAFTPIDKLEYGDHGLEAALETIFRAIEKNKRIALYADYDVDGTMSCVSWIWFLQALGYKNFIHYIPCRFKEGYGLNLKAMKHLIEGEKAELIITMDTGITANEEAAYCRSRGVEFVCTDHHQIQPQKMPDCIILNPKLHPNEQYQELAGCGITFVLLRKLAARFNVPQALWTDLLALAGMATICDVVPLNAVNHRLARLGVSALMRSERPVLKRLRGSTQTEENLDESDVGFRLGPRINAVGRLEHADLVIKAFIDEDPEPLVEQMSACNLRRKAIQAQIVSEARLQARQHADSPLLFLGGDWHPGVLGIAASKLAEEFWRPTWLFQIKDGVCKGSARSIKGFNVTAAMESAATYFSKFGGHRAAAGFTFPEKNREVLKDALLTYVSKQKSENPHIWQSSLKYDCELKEELTSLDLIERLSQLKPFGHGFEEPRFLLRRNIADVRFFKDKATGEPKHTSVTLVSSRGTPQKLVFFNEVHAELQEMPSAQFIVSAVKNTFRGASSLSLIGHDFAPPDRSV